MVYAWRFSLSCGNNRGVPEGKWKVALKRDVLFRATFHFASIPLGIRSLLGPNEFIETSPSNPKLHLTVSLQLEPIWGLGISGHASIPSDNISSVNIGEKVYSEHASVIAI